MTPFLRGLLSASLLLAASAAQAGTSYDLGQGASSTTLRVTGPLKLVGSKTTLSTSRFEADPVLSHIKKSSANGTVEFEVTKFGVINSTTQPAARWTRSTALSIANNTNTYLSLVNREFNTQSLFAVSHATAPTGGEGLYSVACGISYATSATGRRTLALHKNGTLITGTLEERAPFAATETAVRTATTVHLVAGDTVSCNVFHTSGGALNVESGAFEIVKLW